MSSIYAAGIVLTTIVNHLCYQVMLRRRREWGLPVERKSWWMGFSKNLPVYVRALRIQGKHLDGPIITMGICTLIAALCVAGWWYVVLYVRMFR